MFKPKQTAKKASNSGKGQALLQQMGFAMPNMPGQLGINTGHVDDFADNDDLEAELAELAGESGIVLDDRAGKRKVPKSISEVEMQKIIDSAMKTDPMDYDLDVSDTEDPDIENELKILAMEEAENPIQRSPEKQPESHTIAKNGGQINAAIIHVIEDRLNTYRMAQQAARTTGDHAKARRLDRGIHTLQDQLKLAKSGSIVSNDDIPPAVNVNHQNKNSENEKPKPNKQIYDTKAKHQDGNDSKPVVVAPPVLPTKLNDDSKIVEERGLQYKAAAAEAKRNGNINLAKKLLGISIQFESVLEAMRQGQAVDLSKMPPPPSKSNNEEEVQMNANEEKRAKELLGVPDPPRSILEALQQRKEKYQQEANKAEEPKKARRYKRIVEQYEEAIKAHKTGRHVDFDELPSPPGFPPIPSGASNDVEPVTKMKQMSPVPLPVQKVVEAPKKTPTADIGLNEPIKKKAPTPPKSASTRAGQQRMILQKRQFEYKQAAVEAKSKGNLDEAKELLRTSLGLKQMVEASERGLPVDMSQLPPAPFSDKVPTEFIEEPQGDREEMFKKLENDLIDQIRVCDINQEHFLKLSDLNSSKKMEDWSKCARRDLDALKNAFFHKDPAPRFHYETREFTIIKCCSDLGDNDLQIDVIRGIDLPLPDGYTPSNLNTYLKYDFPIPKDAPQSGDIGSSVKGTNCPEYNANVKLQINRKSSAFLRQIKHKSLKIDIFYKRGLFKGDKILGSVNIKLADLETKCELHESHDIYDGRKVLGGKLEVKVRLRSPLNNKNESERVSQRWLILDVFAQASSSVAASAIHKEEKTEEVCELTSIEVLKFECQEIENELQTTTTTDISKREALEENLKKRKDMQLAISNQLKSGGINVLKSYVDQLKINCHQYVDECKQLVRTGDKDKAKILLRKKNIVESEIAKITPILYKH